MINKGKLTLFMTALTVLSVQKGVGFEVAPSIKEQDGIQAELRAADQKVTLRWRFLRPLKSPIDKIAGSIDGKPLPDPVLHAFPSPGETSTLLALIDTTGRDRSAGFERERETVLAVASAKPNHMRIAFAPYAEAITPISPRDVNDLTARLSRLELSAVAPDLNGILDTAILGLSSQIGQRKGIFAFTDGHSRVPLDIDKLAEKARLFGVAITFIVTSGPRNVEKRKLEVLAARTGGQTIDESTVRSFVQDPFLLLESGAIAVIPLPKQSRYVWQKNPIIDVDITYGDKTLKLQTELQYSSGDGQSNILSERLSLLSPPAVIALALVAAVFLLFLMRRHRSKRLKSKPSISSNLASLGVFENMASGERFTVSGDQLRIGRAATNDIVVEDGSVSRLHALVQRDDAGRISVVNLSESNGTFVNTTRVEKAFLQDGDVLGVGSVDFRFKIE